MWEMGTKVINIRWSYCYLFKVCLLSKCGPGATNWPMSLKKTNSFNIFPFIFWHIFLVAISSHLFYYSLVLLQYVLTTLTQSLFSPSQSSRENVTQCFNNVVTVSISKGEIFSKRHTSVANNVSVVINYAHGYRRKRQSATSQPDLSLHSDTDGESRFHRVIRRL